MKRRVASYEEALEILSELARKGDVRAAVALAGHLKKEQSGGSDDKKSAIDELAAKRAASA